MAQQIQSRRSGSGESLWLSMLVDTMEAISLEKGMVERGVRRQATAVPNDRLAALRRQLAGPAAPCHQAISPFSLRN
jgi:hypothetical protein